MPLPAWLIWIIFAIIFLIIEMLTPEFIVASFSLGSFAAALTAALSGSLNLQLIVFSLVTVIFLWKVRPVFLKYFSGDPEASRTNVYSLTGRRARVITPVGPGQETGRVLVGGEDWLAVSVSGEELPKGTEVEIEDVQGTKVMVKKHSS